MIQDGKKMRCLPRSERDEILRAVLSDRRRFSPQRNNIHKSHKNCTSWIQPEISSSGEKTSSNEEEKHKSSSRRSQIVNENASFVTSSHSNSFLDDVEQF